MMHKLCSTLLLVFLSLRLLGQHSSQQAYVSKLPTLQDSLVRLSKQFINNELEPQRYNANYQFIKTLVSALKEPKSFYFPFDSLKAVSIVTAPDNKFRIFTWSVQNDDGTYRFYGSIQVNTSDGSLKLFPLSDQSDSITEADSKTLGTDEWFAAQYYQLISVPGADGKPYYVLLGWKGKTSLSTQKVIDVLQFVNGIPYFGLSIFDGTSTYSGKKRILFEYAREVSMYLNYDFKQQRIVFDHLSPTHEEAKNDFSKYGPDMTYDAFQLSKGRWKFQSNLELTNPPSSKDDLFNDPKKLKNTTQPIRKY